MSDIKEYIMILEGEYIPNVKKTIRVNLDHWDDFPRLMYHWNDPYYKYTPFDRGTITFYDDITYKDALEKFRKLGVSYDELPDETSSHRDTELEEKDDFDKSPYPSNGNKFSHEEF